MNIFLISDRALRADRPLVELLGEAAAAGVDRVQVREKDLEDRELTELARSVVGACRPHGCGVYVNGRFDVALAAGADGVHLPAGGFPVRRVRDAVGDRLAIGVSAHSVDDVAAASDAGADYAIFGPVFETPSKRAYGPPLGTDKLLQAAVQGEIPVYAVGGIDRHSARRLSRMPIAGVAMIRGILAEPDVAAAVGAIREAIARGSGRRKFESGEDEPPVEPGRGGEGQDAPE